MHPDHITSLYQYGLTKVYSLQARTLANPYESLMYQLIVAVGCFSQNANIASVVGMDPVVLPGYDGGVAEEGTSSNDVHTYVG